MAQALYRKYRPQIFADVTGQDHVKRTIQNQIITGKIAHAYLFSGPRGVGKTTIARLLAKAANCEDAKAGEPCNKCKSCLDFGDGKAMDIIEVDAASHTGVDNVRENIIDAVRFAPGQGKFKVFIIDEVHMLSSSAFNALLKTLEEPPAHAIFVLATTEIHKIPATIISRCQRFDFHKVNKQDLFARLKMITEAEGIKVDGEVFDSIIRVSEGCVRDAESLLGQILALGEKNITVEEASLVLPSTYIATVKEVTSLILKSDAKDAVQKINQFIEQGGQMKPFLDEMIEHVRGLMMSEISEGVRDKGSGVRYGKLLDNLLDVRQKNAPEAFPQLPFEIMIVERCQVSGVGDQDDDSNNDDRFPPVMGGGKGGEQDDSAATKVALNNPPPIKVEMPVEKPCEVSPVSPELQPVPRSLEDEVERSEGRFSVEDLKSKWKRCCDVVSRTNIALPMILQKAEPIGIYGSKVHIGFRQSFHFEMMSQKKNLDVLNAAICEIMNCKIDVMPVFEQDETEKVVGELAEAFGGVIVE